MQKTEINLHNLDVIFAIDKSGSMGSMSPLINGKTRWEYAAETIQAFAHELGSYDDDGVDLIFFNNSYQTATGVKPAVFQETWSKNSPGGGTDTAGALKWALNRAISRRGEKNQLIVCLTDGEPNDRQAVADVIVNATKQIERDEQLGILFVQVGNDPKAKQFLDTLDNDLKRYGAKFDIVNVKNIDEIANLSIQAVVNDAFND